MGGVRTHGDDIATLGSHRGRKPPEGSREFFINLLSPQPRGRSPWGCPAREKRDELECVAWCECLGTQKRGGFPRTAPHAETILTTPAAWSIS
jgi:hypothetical protein